MYFPWRGSHFAIIDDGSNAELVISATDCRWDRRSIIRE
jgi:hypothetical protein